MFVPFERVFQGACDRREVFLYFFIFFIGWERERKGKNNGKRAWWAYIHRLYNFNGMGNQNIQKGKGIGKKEKKGEIVYT